MVFYKLLWLLYVSWLCGKSWELCLCKRAGSWCRISYDVPAHLAREQTHTNNDRLPSENPEDEKQFDPIPRPNLIPRSVRTRVRARSVSNPHSRLALILVKQQPLLRCTRHAPHSDGESVHTLWAGLRSRKGVCKWSMFNNCCRHVANVGNCEGQLREE